MERSLEVRRRRRSQISNPFFPCPSFPSLSYFLSFFTLCALRGPHGPRHCTPESVAQEVSLFSSVYHT